MKLSINEQIKHLLQVFQNAGFQCYIVGGFLRDSISTNTSSTDYDLSTNATPDEIIELANKHQWRYHSKFQHLGSINIKFDNIDCCITTWRANESYQNNHQPSSFNFTSNLIDDYSRRDFTINALYYDGENLIDLATSLQDLKQKIIKTIGEPNKRFKEDPLRMLRAIRFANQLSFSIEEETWKAIQNNAHLITNMQPDILKKELLKAIKANHNNLLIMLKDSRLLEFFIPEFKDSYNFSQKTIYHQYDVFTHSAKASDYYQGHDYRMILALFFHDIGKPQAHTRDEQGVDHFKKHAIYSAKIAEDILTRFHFAKKDIKYITTLILEHDMRLQENDYQHKVNRLIVKYNADWDFINNLLVMVNCDNHAKSDWVLEHNIQPITDALQYLKTCPSKACTKIKDLAVNINDIVEKYNIDHSKAKKILNQCLLEVLDGTIKNEENIILRRIENEVFNS